MPRTSGGALDQTSLGIVLSSRRAGRRCETEADLTALALFGVFDFRAGWPSSAASWTRQTGSPREGSTSTSTSASASRVNAPARPTSPS